ncbi:BlaI/MecI/CopY family transcriptional regulator [Streptomyces sp. NPDC054855]
MSDVQPETAGVQAQYATRVAEDLESNRKEQERVGAELAALQQQLQTLEDDHAVLLSMQQALGSSAAPTTTAKATASRASTGKKAVPAPRASANSGAARTKKPTSAKAKNTEKTKDKAAKSAPKATAKKSAETTAGPTLVELIGNHLSRQKEPRSAAEITGALSQELPDRTIKTTVVRTTVEGLVAKGRAQRTKQGSSVFYTAVAPTDAATAPQPEGDAG